MIFVGIVLVLVGLALVIPRGGVSGSAAARNVRIGTGLFQTRGYQERLKHGSRVVVVLAGVAMIVGGALMIWLLSPSD
jgi:hypothetical protein